MFLRIIRRNHSNTLLLINLQKKKDLSKVKNIAVRGICSNNGIFTALVGFFSIA